MICAGEEDDENWTEIHSQRKLKEIMKQAYKILVFEDNRGLPRHLVVAVLKRKSIISRLKI